jgi:uncharacterized RDD family membrane protein YckC
MSRIADPQPAGLARRLAAIVYDGLLLFAVLYLATLPVLFINRGEPVSSGNVLYQLYLLSVAFLFYGWFWTHGGQTLGMRAWRIRVEATNGQAIGWRQALVRFACAGVSWGCLGLGFLWIVVDRRRRAWHDRLSRSVILLLPKR